MPQIRERIAKELRSSCLMKDSEDNFDLDIGSHLSSFKSFGSGMDSDSDSESMKLHSDSDTDSDCSFFEINSVPKVSTSLNHELKCIASQ